MCGTDFVRRGMLLPIMHDSSPADLLPSLISTKSLLETEEEDPSTEVDEEEAWRDFMSSMRLAMCAGNMPCSRLLTVLRVWE